MRFLWLLRDLRERLQAEEALRDAHEALEERVRERTAALVVETAAVKRLALQDVPRLTRTAGHRAGFSPRAARRL
jgi:hypothetical protein